MTRGVAALVAICVLLPLGFVVYAFLARSVLHGPVTDGRLARSVALEARSLFPEYSSCDRIARTPTWMCTVMVDGSSSERWLVRVRAGSSCWEARPARPARSAERLRGCVHRWQWRLL